MMYNTTVVVPADFFKQKIARLITVVCLALAAFSLCKSTMAAVYTAYDIIGSHRVSASTTHEIKIHLNNGINSPADNIILDFTNFTLGSVDFGDVDISHGPVTGLETALAHAAAAGVGSWGIGIVGNQITITPPTDAGAGTVPASDWFDIKIGTNATGGIHNIINSAVETTGTIDITGGFGQVFELALPIIIDDGVDITAKVLTPPPPPPPPPGPGPVTTPPAISNVQAINITDVGARIIWDTDQSADSVVQYGLTTAYGHSLSNSSLVMSHGLDLSGLAPTTTYHFRVLSTNQYGYQSISDDYTFKTLSAPPLLISNVTSTSITDISAIIVWDTNRPASSRVEYGTTPALGMWTEVAGDVIQHFVALNALQADQEYYYRAVSSDAQESNTSSIYSFKTLRPIQPPTNVHLTATAGIASVLLQWDHPPEPDFAGVMIRRRTGGYPTGPTDGDFVYNGLATSHLDHPLTNGATYYYAAYAYNTHGNYSSGALAHATPHPPVPPIPPTPTTTPPIPPIPPIPPVPPGPPTTTPPIPPIVVPPVTPTTTPVIPPTATTTPYGVTVHPLYYLMGGAVLLQPGSDGTYGVPSQASIIISVPTANMGAVPKYAVIVADGQAYSLSLNADGTAFVGAFSAPKSGGFKTEVSVMFEFGVVSPPADSFQVQSVGQVMEKKLLGIGETPVSEAEVTLHQLQNGNWVVWNSSPYGQSNPAITSSDGSFVFVIPNGTYRVVVEKDGYVSETSKTYIVQKNVFSGKIEIIKKTDDVEYALLALEKLIRQPELVEAVDKFEAPALLAVSVLNTLGSIALLNIFSYLRFLFTQPFLLLYRLRKKKWGVVYDAITKQPVEYAVVRLIHFESKLVVQTRVTDKQGRYIFTAKKGNYLLEISKQGYSFPSAYMQDQSGDAAFLDLYHGEVIALKEEEVIALNIPLDSVKSEETPKKVIFKRFILSFQHIVAVLGIILAFVSLVISPTYISVLILLVQIGFYILFRKLAMPARAEPWGLVLDANTKKPVDGAVVRIFDQKFNKLLETLVTDRSGQFGFLVDKNVFYVTAEKAGYTKYVSAPMDLVTSKEKIVDFNILMNVGNPQNTSSTSPADSVKPDACPPCPVCPPSTPNPPDTELSKGENPFKQGKENENLIPADKPTDTIL